VRRAWWAVGSLALLAATPAGRSAAKAALVLSEILPSPLHPLTHFTRAPSVRRIQLPHGPADLYEATPGAPGVVIVHGANPEGIDDPRVRALAGALCRVGRSVLAPSLTLAERRMDVADTTRILDAVDALADRTGTVVMVAFSYGGALALTALAERPSIQSRVRALATVGTYFDILHLIEGVTTGRVYVHGREHPWQPPAAAMGQVVPLLAAFLGGDQAAGIEAALTSGDPNRLSEAAMAVYRILVNTDPRRTEDLVGDLPEDIRAVLERISPAKRIRSIRLPVLALHSRVDPAAPALESMELVEAVRHRARARLTLVGSLRHVTPAGNALGRVRDAPRLVAFTASILRAQERWLPQFLRCSVLQGGSTAPERQRSRQR
jgi:pimeloyl-ACP methyl ester carboxylesterase